MLRPFLFPPHNFAAIHPIPSTYCQLEAKPFKCSIVAFDVQKPCAKATLNSTLSANSTDNPPGHPPSSPVQTHSATGVSGAGVGHITQHFLAVGESHFARLLCIKCKESTLHHWTPNGQQG